MTERQTIEKLKIMRNKENNVGVLTEERKQIIDRNKIEWTTFWRRNINLYIEHKLAIKSYPFQHVSYYLMADSTMYDEIATRGLSKTFRMPVFAFAENLLKPHSKVVFTANTFKQATIVLDQKIKKELLPKDGFSSVINYLYDNKYITVKTGDQLYEIEFFNGSSMLICSCNDSARGNRFTTFMAEECRLMKKGDLDSIFENMAQPRNARFRRLPQYSGEEYQEETRSIYITSNRFKNEWFFRLFQKVFIGYFKDTLSNNRVFAGDIFLAIKYGLKTKKWYLSKRRTMNEADFLMEVLNIPLGECEDSYFTLEQFQQNQIIKKAIIPPNIQKWANRKDDTNRKKREDEIRLLFVDFAFAGSTGSNINDNTVVGMMSIYPHGDTWVRNVEYIETYSGSQADLVLKRIRELYWMFECTYICIDQRSGGEILFNDLTREYIHPELRKDDWNSHGFTVCNESDLHMVSESKLQDLRIRTVDKDAIPCIIPITASSEFNSNMYQDMGKRLRSNEIRFLIDDLEFQQNMEKDKKYIMLTSEEKAEIKAPYVQTLLLINEAINLRGEWRGGLLHCHEPNNGFKDRIVSCCYGNWLATKIINKLEREKQNTNDSQWDDVDTLCF